MSPAAPATVLVVDDEPVNRKLLEALLRADGYRTTTAATGELALASVAAERPDLVLLDVMMPGMDGYEVASTLKSDPSTSNIPIIMVTALDDHGARVRALQAGAEEFLTKPIDKAELWLRVRNLLRLKELSDRLQGHSSALELQVQERTADLHQLAHYDALTCLPNRAFLYDTLRKTLQLADSKRWEVGVLFVDVDHFKSINDTLGHAAGDELLTQLSGRLLESVRARDAVGRLGGDEFALVLLLEGSGREGAGVVAANIRRALETPFTLQGKEVRISASTGIAMFPENGTDADTLLRSADTAMYRAKETERGTFRYFTPTMNADAEARQRAAAAERKLVESTGALAVLLLDDMEAPACAVDASGLITAVNRAWREAAPSAGPVPAGIGVGDSYLDAVASEVFRSAAVTAGVTRLLEGECTRFEHDDERADDRAGAGRQRFALVALALPDGAGAVMCHRESARLVGARPEVGVDADPLTDLPTRAHLLEVLTASMAGSGTPHAAVCIGVDELERVNDSYGYAAGDELLRSVCERVRVHVRDGDLLVRFAGDELVVVRSGASSAEEAAALGRALSQAFTTPFALALGALSVSVAASVGVAVAASPRTAEDLLLAASAAMRDARRRGPGQVSVHTRELAAAASSRVALEAEIRAGIDNGEFVLHYQPIVDLRRRAVIGVEALVRWDHPGGRRTPDEFIPVAEASGLIVPLGAQILEEACRQAAAWSASGLELTMGVNLSARQVADPDLLGAVESALSRAQLRPESLLLEVTESAVIEDAELALATVTGLSALGVGIAIDDFGTGYSSLLYLKRYPIHTLKIDRAFVAGMGVHEDDDAIVASIVNLGRAVSATCTAEGVETAAQAQALRALGCESAQGYFFAKPMPAADIPAAVRDCEARLRFARLVPSPRSRPQQAPNPAAARRAQELLDRGASLHTAAAALNAEGSRAPGGVRWSRAGVARLLSTAPARRPEDRVTC